MARFKSYDYNQLMMVSVCLEEQLLPNTLEYAIHTIVEKRIDLSVFDQKYNNDETGCRAYDPKILLKIVLVGYAHGILSSRKLEKACRENIIFLALTCGQTPDHSTIAAFVSSMEEQILPIFRNVLLICDEENLLGGTCFALDGVKLPSNASKQKSGTFNQLKRKKERLEKKLHDIMKAHQENDLNDENSTETLKRVETLEKSIEKIECFLKENEPKKGRKKKEIKSNITDNDSHQMVTSHGVIQGYNAQAFVDSKNQIIVHADAGDSGQDDEHLAMMVDSAKKNFNAIGKKDFLKNATILADSNYYSAKNLTTCIEEKLNALIPDKDFRKRDSRLMESELKFSIADFSYSPQTDTYTCPVGHTLERKSDINRDGQKYYRNYVACEADCQECQFRQQCLSKKSSRRRYLTVYYHKKLSDFARETIQKIDSDEGRQKYGLRFGIVEPVFANIREQKRMDRFLLRGKKKVNVQWLLYCIVHNIEKILHYGSDTALCAQAI